MKVAITKKEFAEASKRVNELALLDVDFFALTLFATMICHFGFIMNSPTVIIGAMVISPLLNPIIAISGALVGGDIKRLGRMAAQLLFSFVLVVATSAVMSLFWDIDVSNSEIVDRLYANPGLYLIVAILCGLSATFAYYWPKVKEAVMGVAISIAIVPPVVIFGNALASHQDLIFTTGVIVFLNIAGVFLGALAMVSALYFFLKK